MGYEVRAIRRRKFLNRLFSSLIGICVLLPQVICAEPAVPNGIAVFLPLYSPDEVAEHQLNQGYDTRLLKWISNNTSPVTGIPYSFYISPGLKQKVYSAMGHANSVTGIIERMIVDSGISIYDCALWQISLLLTGEEGDLKKASIPSRIFWKGGLGELVQIRAGYPGQPFIYAISDPEIVSSQLDDYGKRGFIFRVLNADGSYMTNDPLDGKTHLADFPNWSRIHWEDWKPIAGENAWVAMAALHIYHRKYYDDRHQYSSAPDDAIELKLAEELARAAMILQADNGGVRMAPLGTYHNPVPGDNLALPDIVAYFDTQAKILQTGNRDIRYDKDEYSWHYYEISTENNLSWYAAFRMLYQITADEEYRLAMIDIEKYLKSVWDPTDYIFHQGAHYRRGRWITNKDIFASDVQNWALAVLGPERIDEWFGVGTSFQIWQHTKNRSGYRALMRQLVGVGYTDEHNRVSVEWTAGAILATRILADYYRPSQPGWAQALDRDGNQMRAGIDRYKYKVSNDEVAYSYSSRRGWIPFGWISHSPEVMSMASSTWVALIDAGVNPFVLK